MPKMHEEIATLTAERDEARAQVARMREDMASTEKLRQDTALRLEMAAEMHQKAEAEATRLREAARAVIATHRRFGTDEQGRRTSQFVDMTPELTALGDALYGAALAPTPPASPVDPLDKWPIVRAFALAMVAKLDHHKAKKGGREGWAGDLPSALLKRVVQELGELRDALHRGDRAAILNEAADVANMAMMVADAAGALLEGDAALSSTPEGAKR